MTDQEAAHALAKKVQQVYDCTMTDIDYDPEEEADYKDQDQADFDDVEESFRLIDEEPDIYTY